MEHLKDLQIPHTLTGHSERRHVYGETDAYIVSKTMKALNAGLNVTFCIGELLEERESGNTEKIVETQLRGLTQLAPEQWSQVVLAYEPVWAIGTGVVASTEQAQEVHSFIRNWLGQNVSQAVADSTRIIYGGSVSEGNCSDLIGMKDIDGFLIGGVSLKPAFKTVVDICQQKMA